YEVTAGDYRIIAGDGGHVIEMEGFGYLAAPGKPKLPSKNFLIALPPGSRVRAVEVNAAAGTPLAGTYNILPSPPIMPVLDPRQNSEIAERLQNGWKTNNEITYSREQAYPDKRGKLKASGTFRKYSYASVSFCPFSYYPQSGRLVYYGNAEIRIEYTLPAQGSPDARLFEDLTRNGPAEEQASRLFYNYEQIKDLYVPINRPSGSKTESYDYAVITTASLQSALTSSSFIGWKTSLGYSVKVVLITDSEITEQAGGDLAEQIRNFLRTHYGVWGIEYVLIIGDVSTVPMRLCYPDFTNHTHNPDTPYNYGGAVPTDHYYADLSYPDASSWDSDGDGFYGEYGQDDPDFLAEVSVGRIPTSDPARILYTLNKLVAFEQDTGFWKNQALHAGAILFFENQNNSGYPFIDGARLHDALETDIMSDWAVNHYSEQEGIVSSVYSWPPLTFSSFTDAWCNGHYGVVNWAGHGSPEGAYRTVWWWDDGDGIAETDGSDGIQSLPFISTVANLDDDYPSIVFAVSCFVGYPESNIVGNLGVDLLTRPGFGAAAGVLSATRPAAISAEGATGGGAEGICYRFNYYMIDGPGGPEKVGDALYDAKFYCNQNFGWDHYYEYQNMFNYNLYGDPSLVREGIPAPVCGDADNDDVINIFDITFIVNYLYKDGPAPESMWVADPDANGAVNILDVSYLVNYLYRNGPDPACQ
ncbi:MAG: hypothetical protein JSU69_11175, partial [Candidatus Zixiibacteriota bacterium]